MSLSGFPEKASKKEVFLIDFGKDGSPVEVVQGKQDDFGKAIKAAVDKLGLGDGPYRLHDWGGVIQHAEEGQRSKLRNQIGCDIVFSFTPWNPRGKQLLPSMIDFARSAGFVAMVIMTCKEGRGGKVDTFKHFRDSRTDVAMTYYEDTYDVIKECVGANTTCYHVPSPEFPVTDKAPGVVDGTVEGYLKLWMPQSGVNAALPTCSTSTLVAPSSDLLSQMNEDLALKSYFGSEACATSEDRDRHEVLSSTSVDFEIYPHLQRWHSHIGHLRSQGRL